MLCFVRQQFFERVGGRFSYFAFFADFSFAFVGRAPASLCETQGGIFAWRGSASTAYFGGAWAFYFWLFRRSCFGFWLFLRLFLLRRFFSIGFTLS